MSDTATQHLAPLTPSERPNVSELSILLVGNSDRSEFRPARSALAAWGQVVGFPSAKSAADALNEGLVTADVIVVAQAFPGEFSHRAIDRLRRAAPLARLLGLLGSWCEGEMRTGKPWPGAVRVYWHQWLPRCSREFERIRQGESAAWGLPPTATEEERLLMASDWPPPQDGLIAIHTRLVAMHGWLSEALRRRGFSTVWLRPPHSARASDATAAVFDSSDCRDPQFSQLEDLATVLRPAPIIALLDFPRAEDRDRALSAGATAVVSKPLHLDDLFWQIDRLLER